MTDRRDVVKLVAGRPARDGAGVDLRRMIGTPALPDLDPFLLLDEIRSNDRTRYGAGFPDHPHRGFETVTYLLDGRMRHHDDQGNAGLLTPGGAQWMTAGRGIVHSEMPEQQDGLLWGFQLWVNLPAAHKMTAPRYQDIEPAAIPEREAGGARVRVVAGHALGADGPVGGIVTEPLFLDVRLDAGAHFEQPIPAEHTAFAYVYAGEAHIAASRIPTGTLAVLGAGDAVELTGGGDGARLLLVAAHPLREPIARYGPFVMNTEAEIRQAIEDFSARSERA